MAVRKTCYNCSGTGTVTPPPGTGGVPPYTCPVCTGDGILDWGDVILESGLFNTYEIVDNTDSTEYNALSDNNKDAYLMIVACGVVDLSDGTGIKTKLWNMFDDQSTTRANLITLIGS